MNFERPANAAAQKSKRAAMGQVYYDKYAKGVENTTMAANTYKKGQKTKLSENFVSTEFDCHGKGCCSETTVNPKLVEYVQKIRDHFGKSITVTSGYRCATHNKNVGGATGSRHSKGDAADIVVSGVTPAEVAKYAESIGIKGIGLYETNADGHFTHIDTRDVKSFWYGQAQAKRTTFGGGSTTTETTPVTPTSNNLVFGSEGDRVKTLQENLIKLGYDLGKTGADGDFGTKTLTAVKDFQQKHNLKVDGIVGPATENAIKEAIKNMEQNIVNPEEEKEFKVGDIIKLKKNATYASGTEIPNWIKKSKLYIRDIRPNGDYVISTKMTGSVSGVVNPDVIEKYVDVIIDEGFTPYLVRITADVLNVRANAGISYKVNCQIKYNGVHTIVGEKDGWGRLKNGSGWIALEYTEKV